MTFFLVMPLMIRVASEQSKVARIVVQFVAVVVMNNFSARQIPA